MYDYVIFTINMKLTHIFLIASAPTRFLKDTENIQHTLTVYGCIKQPGVCNTWVLTNNNDFEDGTINICQNFMNQASINYADLSTAHEGKKH